MFIQKKSCLVYVGGLIPLVSLFLLYNKYFDLYLIYNGIEMFLLTPIKYKFIIFLLIKIPLYVHLEKLI